MSNNNLIPFSKELWETGEYEAATGSCNNVDVIEVTEKGNVYYGENEIERSIKVLNYRNSDALMLRKKTKKVWRPLFETDYKSIVLTHPMDLLKQLK